MHAVDTNVLVRLLTEDDIEQAKRAKALFKKVTVFIPKTVLLETEWVLRRLYNFDSPSLVGAFRKITGLPNVEIEDPLAVTNALRYCEGGMDFADALHLASSIACEKFATFDAGIKKSAANEIKASVLVL